VHRTLVEQGQYGCANVAAPRPWTAATASVARAPAAGELLVPVNTAVSWIASVVHENLSIDY
jgi:hypothetical protein